MAPAFAALHGICYAEKKVAQSLLQKGVLKEKKRLHLPRRKKGMGCFTVSAYESSLAEAKNVHATKPS
eukprot:1145324-Pelagomonas_calceolata.AAC.5